MKRKDLMTLAGFFIAAFLALFLAFMPMLIESKRRTLSQCCVIAFVLTLASAVCFGIQQYDAITEERVRDEREKRRDRVMEQILRNQLRQMKRQGRSNLRQYYAMYLAADMYRVAVRTSETEDKSILGKAYRSIFNPVVTDIVSRLYRETISMKSPEGSPIYASLRNLQDRSLIDVSDVRDVADSLTALALQDEATMPEVEEQEVSERRINEPPF
jgi:hypothetical protein